LKRKQQPRITVNRKTSRYENPALGIPTSCHPKEVIADSRGPEAPFGIAKRMTYGKI
jgi:hypothetical protein